MRCLACGAEMLVEQVAPDDTMPVSGYEHRTLKCPQCGDIERRLVFAGDRTAAEATSVETASAVIETTISVVGTTYSAVETTNYVVETKSELPRLTDGVEDQRDAAPDAGSIAKWAQAVEKVRTRHTALAQELAAEKAAETTATRGNEATNDFDRMWESPLPPRQQPAPRSEPSPPRRRDEPLRNTSPSPAPKHRTPLPRPDAPLVPVRSDAPVAPRPPKRPQGSKTSQSTTSQGATSQGAWARAVAMLRERLDRATKLDRNDAILRIDDDALKVKPRHGQRDRSKSERPD